METQDMERPTRSPDVALAGQMPDSSFATPQWLIQRGDRYLQVSEVLYRIAEACDGTHSCDEIAVLVGATTRKPVTAEDVRALVAQKLTPAGIVGAAGAATPPSRGASPLQINLRAAVIGARVIAPFAFVLSALYLPGIIIAAVAATIGARLWLYGQHGIADGFARIIYEPWHLFLLGAIAIASAMFHELGHAAALRAAGGRARGMGIGLYLIYPVFYTDVTDSYRLSRWRRVMTDLGGFYFNTLFALGLLAAYVWTRDETLLIAVALVDFEILHQTLPIGRLDGYWLLADLTGVPDFFAIAAPFARRVARNQAPLLGRAASVVVALYLILILPLLAFFAYNVGRNLPRFAYAALDSFLAQAARLDATLGAHDLAGAAGAVGSGVLLTLPLLAVVVFLLSITRTFARLFIRAAGRTSLQRIAGAASAAAAIALLLALWSPFGLDDVLLSVAHESLPPSVFGGRVDPIEVPSDEPAPVVTAPPRTAPPLPVVPTPAHTAQAPGHVVTARPATPAPTATPALTPTATAAGTPAPTPTSSGGIP